MFVVLSLLVKEDASLVLVPLGVWVAVKRDPEKMLELDAGKDGALKKKAQEEAEEKARKEAEKEARGEGPGGGRPGRRSRKPARGRRLGPMEPPAPDEDHPPGAERDEAADASPLAGPPEEIVPEYPRSSHRRSGLI